MSYYWNQVAPRCESLRGRIQWSSKFNPDVWYQLDFLLRRMIGIEDIYLVYSSTAERKNRSFSTQALDNVDKNSSLAPR